MGQAQGGPLSQGKVWTEADRQYKCGPNNLKPNTVGYLPDDGKCGPGRGCSQFGWCGNTPANFGAWDGKYDGPKLVWTEGDRQHKCGPNNLKPNTLGYLPDDGKCGPGRGCSQFGWCGSAPANFGAWNGKYNG